MDDGESCCPLEPQAESVTLPICHHRVHRPRLANLLRRPVESTAKGGHSVSKRRSRKAKQFLTLKRQAKEGVLAYCATTMNGVDIHFIWVRSVTPNVLPLLMTHG